MTVFDPHAPTLPWATAPQPNTLQNARPGAPAGALLAQARVHGALFGADRPHAQLGRFRVLERLGAGAMGVVYAAYDPDLDRGVALKLINVPSADRAAALAEAKALARLSHPNVVPIYDVGMAGEHVYLVMELVRGQTLRAWIAGRRARDILEVYQQAGAALAAAHAAGLVHRDFKPDNALVGADGRVRVVDFGLACEADDPALAIDRPAAGTPHFMAPEIAAGAAVTPAADQYSFCVALHEALAGLPDEPAPRTVLAILERGRALDPSARFASMAQLLRALTRATTRRRRRIALAVGMISLVGAAAFLVGQRATEGGRPVDRLAVCEAGADELARAWAPDARATALARIRTLGTYGPIVAPQLAHELTTHSQRWTEAYRGACRDRLRGAETETLSDRRAACVERGRDAFGKLGELIATAGAAGLSDVARATQSLPDPGRCADITALVSDVAAPPRAVAGGVSQLRTELTRARVELDAGRYGEARGAARRAVASARRLDYLPVLAEALLLEGHAQGQMAGSAGDRAAAVPILSEAISVAVAAHADPLAIEAWARRAWALGTSSSPARALDGLEVIAPLAGRTPSARFATALLHNNIGTVALARSDRTAARIAFERAQVLAHGFTGDGALELTAIPVNLGLVTDDRSAGDPLIASAAAERARLLGRDHPDTLAIHQLRVTSTVDDLALADAVLAPVCASYELHPAIRQDAATCWIELGFVRWNLGGPELARAAMARGARLAPDVDKATAYAALLSTDARAGARQLTTSVAALPASDRWWDRVTRGDLLLGLGRAQRELGELEAARLALERAVTELEAVVRAHPASGHDRRLGRARIELAFILEAQGTASPARGAVATAAIRWLRRAGGAPDELAHLARLAPAPARP